MRVFSSGTGKCSLGEGDRVAGEVAIGGKCDDLSLMEWHVLFVERKMVEGMARCRVVIVRREWYVCRMGGKKKGLPVRELNPGHPRDRRVY